MRHTTELDPLQQDSLQDLGLLVTATEGALVCQPCRRALKTAEVDVVHHLVHIHSFARTIQDRVTSLLRQIRLTDISLLLPRHDGHSSIDLSHRTVIIRDDSLHSSRLLLSPKQSIGTFATCTYGDDNSSSRGCGLGSHTLPGSNVGPTTGSRLTTT